MGRKLEALGLALAIATASCGSDNGEQATAAVSPSASAAAATIMGTIVHTEDRTGKPIGVLTYEGPFSHETNGGYPEGAQVPFTCFAIGRVGTDANVPGPNPVVWSVWNRVVVGAGAPEQWVPQPYVHTAQPLPRC